MKNCQQVVDKLLYLDSNIELIKNEPFTFRFKSFINKIKSSFEVGCYETDCYTTNGIWTRVQVTEPPSKKIYDGCLNECYEDFKPLCKVEKLVPNFGCNECVEPFWEKVVEYLEEPPVLKEEKEIGELYPFNNQFCRKIDIEKNTEFTIQEGDCLKESFVLEQNISLLICSNNEECSTPTFFVYFFLPHPCGDSCVYDQWLPVGIFHCQGETLINTYDKPRYLSKSYVENYINNQLHLLIWEGKILHINDLELQSRYAMENLYENCYESCQILYGRYPLYNNVYEDNVFSDWIPLTTSVVRDNKRYFYPRNVPIQFEGIVRYIESFQEISPVPNLIEIPIQQSQLCMILNHYLPSCKKNYEEIITNIECVNSSLRMVNGYRYRYNNGHEFFIPSIGDNQQVYVIDVGYISPVCGEITWVEYNLPIDSKGEVKASIEIKGIKVIKVKRITKHKVEDLSVEYFPKPYIMSTKENIQLNEEMKLDLISLTLIHLLYARRKNKEDCDFCSYEDNYFNAIGNNIKHIFTLFNQENLIPNNLTIFSDRDYIYNPNYTGPIYEKGVYAWECKDRFFTDSLFVQSLNCKLQNCFSNSREEVRPKLEFSIESNSWFLYLANLYRQLTNDNSIDNDIQLLSNSLAGKESNFQESVIKLFSLMKTFDNYPQSNLLSSIVDIHNKFDSLVDEKNKVYSVELNSSNLVYSLFLSWVTHRSDITENLITLIKARTKRISSYFINNVNVNSSLSSINNFPIFIKNFEEKNLSPIYTESKNTLIDSIILFQTLKGLYKDLYNVSFLPLINYYESIEVNSSLYYSYCLVPEIFNFFSVLPKTMPIVESFVFHNNFYYEKLKMLMPTEYDWFSEDALNSGNASKILKYLSYLLSINKAMGQELKMNGLISTSHSLQLDQWGNELNIKRKKGEEDEDYSNRLILNNSFQSNLINLMKDNNFISYLQKNIISIYNPIQNLYNPVYGYIEQSEFDYKVFVKENLNHDSPIGIKGEEIIKETYIACFEIKVEPIINYCLGGSIDFTYEYLCCNKNSIKIKLNSQYNKVIYISFLEGEIKLGTDSNNSIGVLMPYEEEKIIFI